MEESQPESQEAPSVIPLRSQLALEYRLQDLCQRLLESYKDQHDWGAVGQVAQSLVTNSQRVSLLKERLLSILVSLRAIFLCNFQFLISCV